ncbi:S-adenosyl-L-methionine-dependent methyltransferase, partial [Lactarius quietus]
PYQSTPAIQPTIPSPLQDGYRTKITPHFDRPPKKVQKQGPSTSKEGKLFWLNIRFNQIGKRVVMDIEECPNGTPVLNEAYVPLRNIAEFIHINKASHYYSATRLRYRAEAPLQQLRSFLFLFFRFTYNHICIIDHKATIRERVGDLLFDYQAGSFFQHSNSALVPLTSYVLEAISPPTPTPASTPAHPLPPTHLVDAYCGAGLFALTLAPHFTKVAGIEHAADLIRFATHNVEFNRLAHKVSFCVSDAAQIFGAVGDLPRRTALVVDPPRKGCEEAFVRQLLASTRRRSCMSVVMYTRRRGTEGRSCRGRLKRTRRTGSGRGNTSWKA